MIRLQPPVIEAEHILVVGLDTESSWLELYKSSLIGQRGDLAWLFNFVEDEPRTAETGYASGRLVLASLFSIRTDITGKNFDTKCKEPEFADYFDRLNEWGATLYDGFTDELHITEDASRTTIGFALQEQAEDHRRRVIVIPSVLDGLFEEPVLTEIAK